jgi:DNA invertase Pin-like site-specific DNA recombinase
MNTTKRAIAILRVSTDAQDTERQRADIGRVERAHSLTIDRVVPLDGVSGRKVLKNAHMNRVLADLKRPDIAGVVVSALDRLFRLDKFADFGILDNFKDTGKMIWSAKEGALDLRTDAGLIISLMSGAQGGLEWRTFRQRTMDGKEVLRTRGGNANGSIVLPRGIDSEPIKDSRGHSIGARWFYVEPDASRVRQAYDLLFERLSWEDIAERIGGGFTGNGVRSSLKNPIWKGVRRYSKGRETPLEVPIDIVPLILPVRWAEAQKIILEKRSRWAKTRRPPHALLSGLLDCSCGKPCYVRVGGGTRRAYFYCSTNFPGHGPKCGARSVQQEAADQTVEDIMSTQLLDAPYLRIVLGKFRSSQPTRDRDAEKHARQREKLEAERQMLFRMTLQKKCTEEDYDRESKRIAEEVRGLDLIAPAPVPAAFDAAKVVVRITRTFARFAKQPFSEKRTLLRSAVRSIVLEDGAVTAITLNGSFLECVNSIPHCTA